MPPIITVKNLGKIYELGERQPYHALRDEIGKIFKRKPAYKSFWALKGVNFEVKQGEVVGVIGRNGAGKSTLLKILSQITPPTQGQVLISGRVASLLEVGTGFHPELTGRENIFLNGAILGMSRKEISRKFNEIVAFSEIEKFLDTPVKRYSSGMYVRLAFAVAAHLEPEILLVDEVLAVGDVQFQKKCIDKMEEITKSTGRTIIFVSHNMGAIQNLCERSIWLDKGRIKKMGETTNVVTAYLKSSQQESLKYRKDRTGSGVIRLTNIAFLNQYGHRVKAFRFGEPAVIQVGYQSKLKKLDEVNFAIGFDSNIGHRISDISTALDRSFPDQLPGQGSFVCKLPKIMFSPGRYFISVIVRYKGEIVDWIKQATYFDVEALSAAKNKKTFVPPWGSVLINHKWQVKNENR